MLLLSLTTLVGAQDGASAPLPGGIDSKAPEPKKDEPAPAPAAPPADNNAAAGGAPADSNSSTPAAPEAPPAAVPDEH